MFLRSYLQVDNFLLSDEIDYLRQVYDQFLDGTLDVKKHRYDLGSSESQRLATTENITQIMWPSDILESLRSHPMRERALKLVRQLYSDDTFEFDFDMVSMTTSKLRSPLQIQTPIQLISKAPFTNTPTPAHQDQAYWIELPDKRAVSM